MIILNIYYGTLILLAGLCVGSFLNVCIYRLPINKSIINPPSSCPSCGVFLRPQDLFPVLSYIFLLGKCRYCKKKVSILYPIIELVNGLLWVLLFVRFGISIELLASAYITSIMLVMFVIDVQHRVIPDQLVVVGIVGGVLVGVANYFFPLSLYRVNTWWEPFAGALSASGVLFIVAILGLLIYKSDDVMGMGDVLIYIPIGLFLGLRFSILSLLIAVISAGIFSAILIIFKILTRKSTIPFGPFIAVSAIIVLLFGNTILGSN
jgi:leader peptidase (prepilin peptidase)/N-methyltransferase